MCIIKYNNIILIIKFIYGDAMRIYDYIYTVYRERSFSEAAKKLYVSQPTLSIAIRKEEERLGITVFDRSTSPISLTEEGKIYIRALENIRSVERNLSEQLTDMADLKAGHVTVSGENFVSSFIMPEILMEFTRRYSGIRVALVESNSPELRQQLLTEAIDLLIAHDFDPALYTAETLFEEEVLLAVPKHYAINGALSAYGMTAADIRSGRSLQVPEVDLAAFAGEDFLLLKPGNDMCRRARALCAEAGFQPNMRIELDQLITSFNLAASGMGIAFVTDVLVRKAETGGCLYYRLSGEKAKRQMSIGYKKNRYLSHAARAFIGTAKSIFTAGQNCPAPDDV